MKLAVMKRPDVDHPDNYHYYLFPLEIKNDWQEEFYLQVGYRIIDVSEEKGADLVKKAKEALLHQIEIAHIVEAQNKK